MNTNLICWSTAIGAFERIIAFQKRLAKMPNYFERLRFVNDVLGPNWMFRLVDVVGEKTIRDNRPTWHQFYIEDHDGLHAPLDPGAPETKGLLGNEYSIKDLAFYAGMGFDGYCLALQTQRHVDLAEGSLNFDGRYRFSCEMMLVDIHDTRQHGELKKLYYNSYAAALDALCRNFEMVTLGINTTERFVEQTAGASLMLICGGHNGCLKHRSEEECVASQTESIIIFTCAKMLANEEITLADAERSLQQAA